MVKPAFKNRTWQFLGLILVELLLEALFARVYYKIYFEPRSMLFEFEWFNYLAFLVMMSTCVGLTVAQFATGRTDSPGMWGIAGFVLTLLAIWFSPDLIPDELSLGWALAIFLLTPLISTALLTLLIALRKSMPSKLDDEKAK
jgi:hypothetical protein